MVTAEWHFQRGTSDSSTTEVNYSPSGSNSTSSSSRKNKEQRSTVVENYDDYYGGSEDNHRLAERWEKEHFNQTRVEDGEVTGRIRRWGQTTDYSQSPEVVTPHTGNFNVPYPDTSAAQQAQVAPPNAGAAQGEPANGRFVDAKVDDIGALVAAFDQQMLLRGVNGPLNADPLDGFPIDWEAVKSTISVDLPAAEDSWLNYLGKLAADTAISLIPVVGQWYAAYQFKEGENLFGDNVDRVTAAAAALPLGKVFVVIGKPGAKLLGAAGGLVTVRAKKLFGGAGNAVVESAEAAAKKLTGQTHHPISAKVYNALEDHANLNGLYKKRDPRFTTQAVDKAAHNGYETWHRNLDKEVVDWIKDPRNKNATPEQFESYLRSRYSQPDLLERFPNGF